MLFLDLFLFHFQGTLLNDFRYVRKGKAKTNIEPRILSFLLGCTPFAYLVSFMYVEIRHGPVPKEY